jgi:hypothetical protein
LSDPKQVVVVDLHFENVDVASVPDINIKIIKMHPVTRLIIPLEGVEGTIELDAPLDLPPMPPAEEF